ncbi:zinc-dependent peptidase [Flagellimonas sp.]|uniref:zinc-dependent peptidase n=1 Tax=Flagellimonas sp. TaxID=2058762 RepID=UPI003B512C02
MEISAVDIFGFACLLFIFAYLSYIVYYAIGLYELNPFLWPSPLSRREKHLLKTRIATISLLSDADKEKLYKRVAWFRAKKPYSFKGPVKNKEEIKLLVSAAGVLVTLGMKHYKFIRSVHRIVIYPSDYYSILNKRHHVGEYNVGLKTLVFAADTLEKGFADVTDNLNLAIHEFAHALYFETSGKNSWEALRFQWGFKKLKQFHSDALKMDALNELGYFREYGQANVYEFFSILCESYLETPGLFQEKSKELYGLIRKMLNFGFSN